MLNLRMCSGLVSADMSLKAMPWRICQPPGPAAVVMMAVDVVHARHVGIHLGLEAGADAEPARAADAAACTPAARRASLVFWK